MSLHLLLDTKKIPPLQKLVPHLFCSVSSLWILRRLLSTVSPDSSVVATTMVSVLKSGTWFQNLQTIKSIRTLLKAGKSPSKPTTQPEGQFQANVLVISEIHTERN